MVYCSINLYNHIRSQLFSNYNTSAMATAILQGNPKMQNPKEEEQLDNNECWTFADNINRLCKEGWLQQAVDKLEAMWGRGIQMASTDLYAELLHACVDTHYLIKGRWIHVLMNTMGYYKA